MEKPAEEQDSADDGGSDHGRFHGRQCEISETATHAPSWSWARYPVGKFFLSWTLAIFGLTWVELNVIERRIRG